MSTITVPAVKVGDTITTTELSDFTTAAISAVAALDGGNLRAESIGRHQLNQSVGQGAQLFSAVHINPNLSGVYTNTTGAILSHGVTSEHIPGSAISVTDGMLMRVRFNALVKGFTVDGAHVDEDMYFFRFGYDISGTPTYPLPDFGYSMLVRNSGGTLSTDTDLDTSAWDELNFYKYRHVCIEQIIPFSSTYSVDRVFVEYFQQNALHSVTVGPFTLSYEVFQG